MDQFVSNWIKAELLSVSHRADWGERKGGKVIFATRDAKPKPNKQNYHNNWLEDLGCVHIFTPGIWSFDLPGFVSKVELLL